MKLAIIADDLTGANDAGVKLAENGLRTSVMLGMDLPSSSESDVCVFDTDSRSLDREQAYERVKKAAEWIKERGFEAVYKKIDSTMRGNVGAEIDAVYDVFRPDFVIIAPAFPMNGRKVVGGYLYVNGQLLHESEMADDPKTPITDSYVPSLLARQTQRPVALLESAILKADPASLTDRLEELASQGISYIVFDSTSEAQLAWIADAVRNSRFNVLWVGSAGLAHYLSGPESEARREPPPALTPSGLPVMLVVGSVNPNTRAQLARALKSPDVCGIELQSDQVSGSEEDRRAEIDRVCQEAFKAFGQGKQLALYSSFPSRAASADLTGGTGVRPDSDAVASAIGRAAALILDRTGIDSLVLTGGDTAKQVCSHLKIVELELLREVETGIPVGRLKGSKPYWAITKAGSFGAPETLLRLMNVLRGEEAI